MCAFVYMMIYIYHSLTDQAPLWLGQATHGENAISLESLFDMAADIRDARMAQALITVANERGESLLDAEVELPLRHLVTHPLGMVMARQLMRQDAMGIFQSMDVTPVSRRRAGFETIIYEDARVASVAKDGDGRAQLEGLLLEQIMDCPHPFTRLEYYAHFGHLGMVKFLARSVQPTLRSRPGRPTDATEC